MSADAYIWVQNDSWCATTDRCVDGHDHNSLYLEGAMKAATECYGRELFWTPAEKQQLFRVLNGWGYYRSPG